LRAGQVPVEGTEFSFHDEAFIEPGFCSVIKKRNAVYFLYRLAHNYRIGLDLLTQSQV